MAVTALMARTVLPACPSREIPERRAIRVTLGLPEWLARTVPPACVGKSAHKVCKANAGLPACKARMALRVRGVRSAYKVFVA
jgi:hypothetical protein